MNVEKDTFEEAQINSRLSSTPSVENKIISSITLSWCDIAYELLSLRSIGSFINASATAFASKLV